ARSDATMSNAPDQIPIAELQEVGGIDGAVLVEVERRVVWRKAQKDVAESEEVGRVRVAVAIHIAEEAEHIRRGTGERVGGGQIMFAARAVAVAVEHSVGVGNLARQSRERIAAVGKRGAVPRPADKRERDRIADDARRQAYRRAIR